MPSTSDSLETPDGIDVEAVDSVDGPRLRSIASASARPNDGPRPGYHHRVRVAALAAEVELLEAERERLDEQVDALAAEVEELESEVETLEQTVESEEQQRQQVINSYETIVRERSEAHRRREADSTASAETENEGPLDAVASRLKRVVGLVRRSNE
jgi:predicted RNase H-like nuclease (RuvC/YqgF family)